MKTRFANVNTGVMAFQVGTREDRITSTGRLPSDGMRILLESAAYAPHPPLNPHARTGQPQTPDLLDDRSERYSALAAGRSASSDDGT